MTFNAHRIFGKMRAEYQAHPLLFLLRSLTVLAVTSVFVLERNFWTPDTLFIVLLALFVVFGKAQAFLYRFVPFVGLLLVYDSFRGIADQLNHAVHYLPMINFDKFLFGGTLPTVWLQQLLWHGYVSWYDFYFYFLYTIHFVVPVFVALLIWWRRDKLYWPYMWGFIFLSFAGFLTYVIFPAAPPWMAAANGFVGSIHHISSDVWYAMGITNYSEIYSKLSPNEVAAVPSLHAAYPTLMFLFISKAFGLRRTWWLIFYPISVWVGVVYLGEHYVFDVTLGILYAFVSYKVSMGFFEWVWNGGYQRLKRRRAWKRGFELGQRLRTRTRRLLVGEQI